VLNLVASTRLFQLDVHATSSLVGWGNGDRQVDLRFDVPSALGILQAQAQGRRIVSLLDRDQDAGVHKTGLAFAVHDLCHLDKFVEEEHHHGQVGFFGAVHDAITGGAWDVFDRAYDGKWRSDRDAVVADMNGSAIFLFAALKMKLKMAARRAWAERHGFPPPEGGPLGPEEERHYGEALDALLETLDLQGPVADAARLVSTRREHREAATCLLEHWEERGRERLSS
jgi:hypothetical protein